MPLLRAEFRRYQRLLNPPLFHDRSQVLYLPFDKDDGSYARDRSGYNNHGTLYGPTRVAGKVAGALSFDGSTNYLNVPDSLTIRDAGGTVKTICFWANFSSLSSAPNILMVGTRSAATLFLLLYGSIDRFRVAINTATGGQDIDCGTLFTSVLNSWHHFCMVYNGGNVYFYLDSVQKNSGAISGGWKNEDVYFRVALNPASFSGVVDEVRIFNRALSAAEIARVMNMRGI